MSVKINIFYPRLQEVAGEGGPLTVQGITIGECLDDFVRQFPPARDLLFDEQGSLTRHVFVFINEESLYQPGLDAPVCENDTLIIASLVSGG